jgi:hypothetical protein
MPLPPVPPALWDNEPALFRVAAPVRFLLDAQESFAIPPPRPPLAYVDDGLWMKWGDWRTLLCDDTETRRALPPTPPTACDDELRWVASGQKAMAVADEVFSGLPPVPANILTAAQDDPQIVVDWRMGYARFAAASDEMDSHSPLSTTQGGTPRGRSMRFGLGFPSYR